MAKIMLFDMSTRFQIGNAYLLSIPMSDHPSLSNLPVTIERGHVTYVQESDRNVQNNPKYQEEREERPEPQEYRLHDEPEGRHCDPVCHPVDHEPALPELPGEVDLKSERHEGVV